MRCWLSALVLVGVSTLPASAQMQWKFKEGDKFYMDMSSKINQTMKIMGQEVKQDFQLNGLSSWAVKKQNADQTVVIDQTIESMSFKGGALPIDDKIFEKMKGLTFTVTVDPKGDVKKVEGYAEGMKKVLGENPLVAKMMEGMFSEDTVKKQFADMFAFLPDKEVKKGDKWERQLTTPLGPLGSMTVGRTYTYDGPQAVDGKTVEKISYTETITSTAPKKGGGGLPFEVTKFNFKSDKSGGAIYFDAAAGRPTRTSSRPPP